MSTGLRVSVEAAPITSIRRSGRVVVSHGVGRRARRVEMTVDEARRLAAALSAAADQAAAMRGEV